MYLLTAVHQPASQNPLRQGQFIMSLKNRKVLPWWLKNVGQKVDLTAHKTVLASSGEITGRAGPRGGWVLGVRLTASHCGAARATRSGGESRPPAAVAAPPAGIDPWYQNTRAYLSLAEHSRQAR